MRRAALVFSLFALVACSPAHPAGDGGAGSCSLVIDSKGTFDCDYLPPLMGGSAVDFNSETHTGLELDFSFPPGIGTWHCQMGCQATASYQDPDDYPNMPNFGELCPTGNSPLSPFGDCSIDVMAQTDTDVSFSYSAMLWDYPPGTPGAQSVTVSGSGHAHLTP